MTRGLSEADHPDLSVVIPAWNEVARLPATLERVRAALGERPGTCTWEVVVVSDGSDDGTDALVEQHARADARVRLLRHEQRRGKGAAVRTGVLGARGRRILYSDADLATPIEDLPRLEEAMGDADVAIASRRLAASEITRDQGFIRRSMGRFFPVVVRTLTGLPYADTQCGFKLFEAGAARRLFEPLVDEGFAFDVEILARARELGLRVAEVGVHWEDRAGSTVSTVRDPLRMTAALLRMGGRRDLPAVQRVQVRRAMILGWGLVLIATVLASTALGTPFGIALTGAVLLGALGVVLGVLLRQAMQAGWLGAAGAVLAVVPPLFACGLAAGRVLAVTGHLGEALVWGLVPPLPALVTAFLALRLRSVPLVAIAFGLAVAAAVASGLHALAV
jgi:glycosyltransferase involved in cell wall biosynthesis